jgi:hypothetical protein
MGEIGLLRIYNVRAGQQGHPLLKDLSRQKNGGQAREKTPLSTKKYIFFRLSSYFRVSTASLYCHLFSHPVLKVRDKCGTSISKGISAGRP